MKPRGIVIVPLLIMIAAVVIFGIAAYFVFVGKTETNTNAVVSTTVRSFDDCVAAGNPVTETYPPTCRDHGVTFTQATADANTNTVVNTNTATANTNTDSTSEPVGTTAKRYTSPAFGISFVHANTDGGKAVNVQETTDTIYVYMVGYEPASGQYVRQFTKDAGDTLSVAVEKQFLSGYASTDCFVKLASVRGMVAGWEAVQISFPPPADPQTDNWWINSEKCPKTYTTTNGASYFVMNAAQPTKLYYLSIGQYAIPSDNADYGWEGTLQPIATTASVPANWKTYTDATNGYTVQYPPTWEVSVCAGTVWLGTEGIVCNSDSLSSDISIAKLTAADYSSRVTGILDGMPNPQESMVTVADIESRRIHGVTQSDPNAFYGGGLYRDYVFISKDDAYFQIGYYASGGNAVHDQDFLPFLSSLYFTQ